MYYKNHDRRNCISRCKVKINTNNSTSVEHNSQPLAQNKFNNRQPIQNLTVHLLWPNKITFTRAVSRVASNYLTIIIMMFRYASAYIEKRSRDANSLVNARLFYNSLERSLCSNALKHSTINKL